MCIFCMQKLYKMYITDTKFMQNVYKMYPTLRQTFVYIFHTKFEELWQLNLFTKSIEKFVEMWDTFCIGFVYIDSSL